MDFLDPQKQKYHRIRLWVGYGLISIAVVLASIILLYLSFGFRINREGQVTQNGLVFVSSRPSDAEIFANGGSLDRTTGSRLSLAAGQYTFELKREGYRDWKRGITVEGGSVQRFDYPFLFPVDLRTTSLKTYEQAPPLLTQSPSHRWLLTHNRDNTFDLFDLDQDEPVETPLTIPTEVLSADSTTTGWQEVQWADDNRRVVLKRTFEQDGGAGSEYILVDREQPGQSRNLTVLLGFNPDELRLRDHKFDRYYAFDKDARILFTASIDEPTPQPLRQDVLAFAADGPETVLYATDEDAADGKTLVYLLQDDDDLRLREVPRSREYMLGLARYQGAIIAAAGEVGEDRVFVYKNPQTSIREGRAAAPIQILKVDNPEQVLFSVNARFVMLRGGASFATFDAETDRGYAYDIETPVDTKLSKAFWMDGHRMMLSVGNNLTVFDYDGTNQHTLLSARPGYKPAFNGAFTFMYTLSPDNSLDRTSLRTEQDE